MQLSVKSPQQRTALCRSLYWGAKNAGVENAGVWCHVLRNNLCVKSTLTKSEEQITNNRTVSRHYHISFHNVLNHKYHIEQYITVQKQVYVKLNKAKMRIMQLNCLCEIYQDFLNLIHRCLNLFLGWLSTRLTPAFSTPAILPVSHFSFFLQKT